MRVLRPPREESAGAEGKGEPVFAQNESILSYAACLGVGLPETEGDCPPKLRAIGNLPLTGQGISACGRGNLSLTG